MQLSKNSYQFPSNCVSSQALASDTIASHSFAEFVQQTYKLHESWAPRRWRDLLRSSLFTYFAAQFISSPNSAVLHSGRSQILAAYPFQSHDGWLSGLVLCSPMQGPATFHDCNHAQEHISAAHVCYKTTVLERIYWLSAIRHTAKLTRK
ncbi:hypothetical protein ABBQ32_010521 [Trebouxia sp. C0010 RCD-2024]